jgi:putative endonuclease
MCGYERAKQPHRYHREKQLKAGSRQNKINLVLANNPAWNDLSIGWYE